MAVNATKGAVDFAKEADIDLSKVKGTGKNGLILKKDVTFFAEIREPEPEKEVPKKELEKKPEDIKEIPDKKPEKVETIEVPAPVAQPKSAPPGEYDFLAEKVISDNNLLHLVRFKGKTRWLTKQQIIVTLRDTKHVKAVTDDSLSEAEMLRKDVFYMEFPRFSLFTEKKR